MTREDVEDNFNALLNLEIRIRDFRAPSLLTETSHTANDMDVTFFDASRIAVMKTEESKLVTADETLYLKVSAEMAAIRLSELP